MDRLLDWGWPGHRLTLLLPCRAAKPLAARRPWPEEHALCRMELARLEDLLAQAGASGMSWLAGTTQVRASG